MNIQIKDDGILLDAELAMPAGREQNVPLCIILHGFTGNKEELHLVQTQKMMNGLGMATLRFDLYGHGKSGGDFTNHTLYKWITNTFTVLDYARKTGKFTKIYLCGHSQGGLVAILAGAMKMDQIDGLIPLSPAVTIPGEARSGCMLGHKINPKQIPDEFKAREGWILGGNYVRVAQFIHVEEYIAAFTKPVLIVHGSDDATIPVEAAKEMAKGFADCQFVEIEGDTHCYDHHLDQVVEAVRSFLIKRHMAE